MGRTSTIYHPKSRAWMSRLLMSALAWSMTSAWAVINDPVPRFWIDCTGSPPSYTVNWTPSGPPATLALGTSISATVTFTNGTYTPGHWSDAPSPSPAAWPWIGPGFFAETVRISHDNTSVFVRIRGSHAADMCTPGAGNIDMSGTETGRFNVQGGNNQNNTGDGGPMEDSTYEYDPGDNEIPVSSPTHGPGFPWDPLAIYPVDDDDPDGEVHGEVTIDAPSENYELLNYAQHPDRGRIPTLCKAPIIIKPIPAGATQPEEQEVNLSLSVTTVKTSETPIEALLVIQPSDTTIANEDYEIRTQHNGQLSGVIANWPYTTSPADSWTNNNPGIKVYRCSPTKGSKLKILPKTHPDGRAPRPITLHIKYQPRKPASSNVSYEAKRATQLDLLPIEIIADTNRDGSITAADSSGKNNWSKSKGAIFSVNYDADEQAVGAGGPLPDTVDFDDNGDVIYEDYAINAAADIPDITPFKIREMLGLPGDYKVFLSVPEEEDRKAIHVFSKLEEQAEALWGGGLSTSPINAPPWNDPDTNSNDIEVTKWLNPNANPYVGTTTNNYHTFGIEGLLLRGMKCPAGTLPSAAGFFSGEICLQLEIRNSANAILATDKIRLRVAPWLGQTHEEASEEIWVAAALPNDPNNYFTNSTIPFRVAPLIGRYTGLSNSGQVHQETVGNDAASQWFQDHVEFGFTQRPGGPKVHLVFRVPYKWNGIPQPNWARTRLLRSDVGIFQIGIDLNLDSGGDYGGNLELLPPSTSNPLGVALMGDLAGPRVRAFLEAQEFQYKPGKSFAAASKWLKVGHIDEYASFLSGGRVLFADSRMAIELLENQIPTADRAKRVFFATSGNTFLGSTTAATSALDDPATTGIDESKRIWTGINHLQLGHNYQYIRFYEGAASGHVAKVSLGDGWVQVTDEISLGAHPPLPAIWFTGATMSAYEHNALYGIPPTGWQVLPVVNDKFVMVEGTKRWAEAVDNNTNSLTYNGMPALISVKEVLADSAFVTFNRTQCPTTLNACQAAIQAAAGQDSLSFISLPALFFGAGTSSGVNERTASAFNPGPTNLQPLGGALYMPRQFGPVNAQGMDFLEEALKSTVQEIVYFVDDWEAYHRYEGEVHCGSSVKRSVPAYDWWAKLSP